MQFHFEEIFATKLGFCQFNESFLFFTEDVPILSWFVGSKNAH